MSPVRGARNEGMPRTKWFSRKSGGSEGRWLPKPWPHDRVSLCDDMPPRCSRTEDARPWTMIVPAAGLLSEDMEEVDP